MGIVAIENFLERFISSIWDSATNLITTEVKESNKEIIDLLMTRVIQEITLVSNTAIDDNVIAVTSVATPLVGSIACLKEGTAFYQGKILAVVANGSDWDLTLDTPLDFAFTTAGGCSERSANMAVDGSVTPVTFFVTPAGLQAGTEWAITRVTFQMLSSGTMDDGLFGNLMPLAKGIVLRVSDGINKNIFNAKTNGDLALRMYDVTYVDKAPASLYGLRGRRTFSGQNKNGVIIKLCADSSDELQLIVQDDLSTLSSFQFVAQGRIIK